jgi:WD40 repeat protein
LKFSPDGSKLAVTTHEGKIWLFDVHNDFAQIGKVFGKTTSFITQIDWSLDGELVRTTDASYELLYYTVSDGKQQTAGASAYKDTEWATHNVIYSFQA